jgi:ATP-binding cassette subfamily B (MDR/TAP) protein 1
MATGDASVLAGESKVDRAAKAETETASPVPEKGGEEEAEAETAKKGPEKGPPPVSYFGIFRFADALDVFLLVVAYTSAILGGVVTPLSALVLGGLLNALSNPLSFDKEVDKLALYLTLVGLGCLLFQFLGISLALLSAERQTRRVRVAFMRALLRQDQAWYDKNRPGEAASRLTSDTLNFQAGMGDKVTLVYSGCAQFVTGFIIAFAVSPDSWRLALVLLAFVPLIVLVFGLIFALTKDLEGGTDDAYARAGDVANESLTLIRTVAAFGGERSALSRYDAFLKVAEVAGYKKGLMGGISGGCIWLVIMTFYGVGLYSGAWFVVLNRRANPDCVYNPLLAPCFSGGQVIQSLFALITGAAALGLVGPNLKFAAGAQAAAARLFETIDRVPTVDSISTAGYIPPGGVVKGRITFKNVTFRYPTRMDVAVLSDFSLDVAGGETVAIVGQSGSGKSTLVALVQRWYDPNEGSILLDGIDVKEYNLPFLRSIQGLVTQEPQLMPGSIFENIALGKSSGTASNVEVEGAAKAANAHGFISALKDGYETSVTGGQLSGGQKQRVAIARALVRAPPVLLLDEATSALDTTSERIVQASIDALLTKAADGSGGRTTLMIAHRLSTVTRADRIIVLESGRVVEEGTHETLLARGGTYTAFWDLQRLGSDGASPTSETSPAAAFTPAIVLTAAVTVEAAPQAGEDAVVMVTNPLAAGKVADEKDAAKPALPVVMDWAKLWEWQKPELPWVIVALISALLSGCLFPGFSLILANFFEIFFEPKEDVLLAKAAMYLGIFLGVAVAAFGVNMICGYAFGVMGERLILRLRQAAFRSTMRMEVGYFDLPEHSVGALTSRLGNDASQMRLVLGARMGDKVSSLATAVMGTLIAFTASWRLSLLVIAVMPIALWAQVQENKVTFTSTEIAKAEFAKAGAIVVDATSAMRVVNAFGLQPLFLRRFEALLAAPYVAGRKRAFASGFGFGTSQFMQSAIPALVFWVGAVLIKQGQGESIGSVLRVYFALTFSLIGLQNVGTLSSDLAQLSSAFMGMVALIERHSIADATVEGPEGGFIPANDALAGRIELKDVHFTYPSRPEQPVLRGLSLSVAPGTTVALVGPSGSGKSTVVQLLLRFYEPASGSVSLDGRPLKEYNPGWVRSKMGWVQQEAPLFADSLAFNIEYGKVGIKPEPDQGVARDAPEGTVVPTTYVVPDDVLKAAADANVSDYVGTFPYGFATFVGTGGLQLSGGQKQRVAIARAIIRSPPILLLDEATSALDSESERVVQASIDRLRQATATLKRTTILIAHRLSTVKDADLICVIDGGVVVEQGSHAALMALGGVYRRLALAQDPDAR